MGKVTFTEKPSSLYVCAGLEYGDLVILEKDKVREAYFLVVPYPNGDRTTGLLANLDSSNLSVMQPFLLDIKIVYLLDRLVACANRCELTVARDLLQGADYSIRVVKEKDFELEIKVVEARLG